jgi:ribA/ribD-fused uncharacterized protein
MRLIADQSQIRTYRTSDCVVFKKTNERFGGLSNMAPGFPLVVNGVHIPTSEALYQACRFPHMPKVQRLVISQPSPMTAKMKSKPHRKNSRSDWNQVRVGIMRWCLRVKLAQNWQKFSELLLATNNHPIVEESRKDDFWGAKPLENGMLVGQNVLGRLLMELREELRDLSKEQLRCVRPPEIPDFLLYGEAVREFGGRECVAVAQSDLFAQPADPVSQIGLDQNASRGVMIPKECKRLAEVDFPIAVVSKHSLAEKKIFLKHPQGVHQWWARRPLAACRAMLLGLLLPDPCDQNCPEDFKIKARNTFEGFVGVRDGDEGLRKALLTFIGNMADWDVANHPRWIGIGRDLVKAAYPDEVPLVVDPFAGGGSIPLEALRLGCDAFASDLNPVAGLMLKLMLEHIPRHGPELAEELRRVGREIKKKAETELAEFYPKDPDGSTPIAYLWARTVRCESPNCGSEIPLVRSLWLSNKPGRHFALDIQSRRRGNSHPIIELQIIQPKTENEVGSPLVSQAKATCPYCGSVLSSERVRQQLSEQRGGTSVLFDGDGRRIGGAMGLAVVRVFEGQKGRDYRIFNELDYKTVWRATQQIEKIAGKVVDGLQILPHEPINSTRPSPNARGLSAVTRYGMTHFQDLFTTRQLLMLSIISQLIREYPGSEALRISLAFAVSRMTDRHSSLVGWYPGGEATDHVFRRQALPMRWDFAEATPLTEASGSLPNIISQLASSLEACAVVGRRTGTVELADARSHPLPDMSAALLFTDPPYYDSVPYADLSDYFFVWLKRALPKHPFVVDPFDPNNELTPKAQECVWNRAHLVDGKAKDARFFEECTASAFTEGRRVLREEGVGCVIFAHKTTEGWEALLSGMVRGGLVVLASWPILTERGGRMLARDTAALAASVHLVCRPRSYDAPIGDWGDVLRELPKRIGDWMQRLQGEGIRGADLVFACIGPALEIFSRYSKVETAEGREVKLAEYLEKVWEVVGRTALEQVLGTAEARARNGIAGALEEDARLTALFLWTLQATNGQNGNGIKPHEAAEEDSGDEDEEEATPKGKSKGYSLVFDVVRRFAQPLGIELPKWEDRIIETKKGVVRLLSVSERARQLFGKDGADAVADWIMHDPRKDVQLLLFPELSEDRAPKILSRKKGRTLWEPSAESAAQAGVTTLDRVHAAMLLQAGGKASALRALIKAEQERGPDFLRLANALSALYPKDSEEKRLLDAMLLAVPR